MQRTETLAAEAHRKMVESGISDIATFLQEMLGRGLVAHIAGTRDTKNVWRWAKGESQPRDEAEKRLRLTYQILQLLLSADSSHVARAWLVGMNPQLDDDAPADAIREGRFREVLSAAKAYVAGG
jgi:hypothetical protein